VQSRALRTDAKVLRRLGWLVILGAALLFTALGLHPPVANVTLFGLDGAAILFAEVVLVAACCRGNRTDSSPMLAFAFGGLTLLTERLAALRETVRIARGGADQFAANASSQGLLLFGVTLLLVATAIAWAVARVRRDLRSAD
jgi:hypothetical protein